MNKKLIKELSELIAELDGEDFKSLPFHRKLTYRGKARNVIKIIKKYKEKKKNENGLS